MPVGLDPTNNSLNRIRTMVPVAPLLASGFLPTRGSLVLDAIVCAMALVLVILGISVYLVRYRRLYRVHRMIQVTLCVLLAIAVTAFEVDVRFFTDWRAAASFSPFYEGGWVDRMLVVHLLFAVPTPLVWGFVIVQALRHFPNAQPGPYSFRHRRWGWIAVLMMTATAVTGWVFYWFAFVA